VIVVDTNVFVTLSDRRDAHHAECRDWLAGCDEPLIVPPTVLAEACYLIDKYLGAESEAKFLDSVGVGPGYRF
jgi:predicted nucleic acid-binding protein